MQRPNDSGLMAPTHPDVAADLALPSHWKRDVAVPELVESIADPQASVEAALADPLQSPPLRKLAKPGDQVCIALAPPAAPSPDRVLVPAMLRELEAAGVRDEDVTLLYATGPHGRTDHEHKVAQFGAEVVERFRVVDHDVGEVIHLGQWQNIPLTVNRAALEADLLVTVGVVAPHLYAGYSGGGETLALGCAGDATIEGLYAPRFLFKPQVRPGQVIDNPFQEVVEAVVRRAGLRFVLNGVLDPQGRILDVQAGEPTLVQQHLICFAASLYNVVVPQTYDVVVAGLDPPHGDSLYQAVLGALFVGMAPKPTVRPGGVILLPARTPRAVGEGGNAQNFFNALQSARSPEALIPVLWEQGCRPGEARAFQLARLLELNHVIVIGSEFPAMVEVCHLQAAADMEEAVDVVRWLLGDDLDALVIPHALHSMPVPSSTTSLPGEDGQTGESMAGMQAWY